MDSDKQILLKTCSNARLIDFDIALIMKLISLLTPVIIKAVEKKGYVQILLPDFLFYTEAIQGWSHGVRLCWNESTETGQILHTRIMLLVSGYAEKKTDCKTLQVQC